MILSKNIFLASIFFVVFIMNICNCVCKEIKNEYFLYSFSQYKHGENEIK